MPMLFSARAGVRGAFLPGTVDFDHPINDSLVFACISSPQSSLQGLDQIGGEFATATANASLDGRATYSLGGNTWYGPESTSETLGAVYWEFEDVTDIHNITTDFTFAMEVEVDSYYTTGQYFSHASSDTHTNPWNAFFVGKYTGAADTRVQKYTTTPAFGRAVFNTGLATADGSMQTILVRSGTTTVEYWLNGTAETDDDYTASGAIDWGDGPFSFFNNNGKDLGQGMDGGMPQLRIWDRKLTDAEIDDWHADTLIGIAT